MRFTPNVIEKHQHARMNESQQFVHRTRFGIPKSLIQKARDAGLALLYRPANTTSKLHYNTTSRYQTDGEWPSIILIFYDGTDFELRPLFFAYEDREQMVLLLVETNYGKIMEINSGKTFLL